MEDFKKLPKFVTKDGNSIFCGAFFNMCPWCIVRNKGVFFVFCLKMGVSGTSLRIEIFDDQFESIFGDFNFMI